jgi:UDP-glucose 4-epimerase
MNFLITGGCGFIGTSLIIKLLEKDSNALIRVVDNFVTGTIEDLSEVSKFKMYDATTIRNHKKGVGVIEGDIRDAELMVNICQDIDTIVHLAANTGVGPSVEDPRLDMECNVVGTFNMLEAARLNNIKNFVFASSGAPAGEVEPPIHEELPPHPVSPYGSSKLAGEGYCSSYSKTFGIETVALRFGNVYGPRSKNKASVVAKFIKEAMNGETCMIYGDGRQTRDFIYIDDLVRAVMLGIESDVGGETFQIATGRESTVGEVAQMISDELSRRGVEMKLDNEAPRLGDVARNFSDTTKAKEILGWAPKMTLPTGIARTIEYFIDMEEL